MRGWEKARSRKGPIQCCPLSLLHPFHLGRRGRFLQIHLSDHFLHFLHWQLPTDSDSSRSRLRPAIEPWTHSLIFVQSLYSQLTAMAPVETEYIRQEHQGLLAWHSFREHHEG